MPYSKDVVRDAPRIDTDTDLSQSEEDDLYAYYERLGLAGAGEYSGADRDTAAAGTGLTEGHDTCGPNTDTRSEERVHVGTERVATGRARLRKYVVTEQQTVNVPVTRGEVRLEREPITEGNIDDALDGPDISEEEHEVVLTEERPVVAKETVPVERVRLGTERVTDTERVDADVRREEIQLEDGTTPPATER
ncbi:MAG TPA: YsnF/AvaK domain-containing protein [Microbacterium sp.]|nr:YsnF/AvaK domain-containing protein [Microbacterium sp.]